MAEKASTPAGRNPAEDVLGGGIRGEVAGCPTGLSEEWQPPPPPEGQEAAGTQAGGAGEPRSDGGSRPRSDNAG